MKNNLFILLEELNKQAQTTDHIPLTQFRRSDTDVQISTASEDANDFLSDMSKNVSHNPKILREFISSNCSAAVRPN